MPDTEHPEPEPDRVRTLEEFRRDPERRGRKSATQTTTRETQ